MTYQNEHVNRQTAHGLRPLSVLVLESASVLLLCAARAGAGLVSGFVNLCVFMPPEPILQNSGGNWLKCRNGSFVILELTLSLQKPRPKDHRGALNHLGKNCSGQSCSGKSGRGRSRRGTDWSGDHSRGAKFNFCQRCAAQGHYAALMA
jgi:hypothetical protein